MQKKSKIIIFVILIILLIVFGFLASKEKKGTDNFNTQKSQKDAFGLTTDIYPLYPSLSWGEKTATTSEDFGLHVSGFKIDSKSITDDEYYKLGISFDKYYEDKLSALGWVVNNDYAADGPASSILGYEKDGEIIILSHDSKEINPKSNEPFSCPCNMTFSVFWGKKQ